MFPSKAWFRRQSVAHKLTGSALITSAVTLIVACAVFVSYDYASSRSRLLRDVTLLADLIGTNSSAALEFADGEAAAETLGSAAVSEHIQSVRLFMSNGASLATYVKPGHPSSTGSPLSSLRVVRPVVFDGRSIGTIEVESDTAEVWARAGRVVLVMAGTLIGALVLAFLFARATARTIFDPIARLIAVTRLVREKGRYDVRAAPGNQDEIGELIGQFNAMLSEVQQRDEQLLEQQNSLERTVEARTRELKASNEQLVVARDRAMAASREKSEFLANMSHEIRTPMNGIIGMADLVLDGELPPDQRDRVDTVRSSAHTLLSILNDILDFSKIESHKLTLEAVRFSPRAAVMDALNPFALRARQKGLELACTIDPNVPALAVGDPTRIQQVLVNLIGNALKFTDRGQVRVTLREDAREGGRATLHFGVADTGIGIPRDKQTSIFEPFQQADGSITRRFGGTGLGLTISSALVQLMGGRLWVESTPGRGSTFHFVVGLEIGDAAAGEDTTIIRPAASARSKGGAFALTDETPRVRVLLVEDNPVNQRVAAGLLSRRGHHVTIASDGRQALARLEREAFDLVLMDLQMPGMGGLDATLAIRQSERATGKHLRIIAMTAHAMTGDRDRCLAAGMDGYVTKPIDPAALFAAVERREVGEATAGADAPAVFDGAALLRRLSGDAPLLADVTRMFLEDLPRRLAAIADAVAGRNAEAIRIAAHALKGSAANMSADRLAAAADALERVGAESRLDAAEAAAQHLSAEATLVVEAITPNTSERPCVS